MIKNHIDIILYSSFLIFNLVVGLWASRSVKTLREFSIGNKDFSTATITSTIVSTWIGGGFMFYGLQNIYTNGLLFFIPLLGAPICLLFTGRVLAVRMGEFLDNLSVAEAMGELYGRTVRVITAISGNLSAIGGIAIQFQVISKMITMLLGVQGTWVTVIAASIVILYSAFGGIRSVIVTDVFQFIVFSIFIPILALVVWNHLKNPVQVTNTLATNPIFNLRDIIGWNPKFLSALGLLVYFAIPGLTPAIFQRVTIAKDLKQVKNSFSYAALSTLLVYISVAWISILLLSDNSKLDPNSLVNYIITTYAYPGLKGLIAIGITAMAMSTADSFLNSSAVLVVNDIIKPFRTSWKAPIIIVRLFSLGLGLCALVLALHTTDLLKLMLLAGSFYMPIVTVPLLLAIFGFRSTPRAALIGMIAGFIIVSLWDKLLGHIGIGSLMPGMIANLLFLMGSHYILREPKGWVGIKEKEPLLAARQNRREAWISFIHTIKNTNLYNYLDKNLPNREITYFLTAIYILFSTYLSFYFLKDNVVVSFLKLEHATFHSVLTIAAILLTYPLWKESFKNKRWLIVVTWYSSIIYIFFFLGSLLALFSGIQHEFLLLFVSNLIMASFLLPSPVFIAMLLFSLPASWFTFKAIIGVSAFPITFNFWHFKVIYMWMLLGSSLVVIFNLRNKYIREKAKTKRLHLEKLEIELKAKIFNILQGNTDVYQTEINLAYPGMSILFDKVMEVLNELKGSLEQFSHLKINTILNEQLVIHYWSNVFIKLNREIQRLSDKVTLTLTKVSPAELICQTLGKYRETVNNYSEVVTKFFSICKKIECDVEKISSLIINTLERAQAHNPNRKPLILRLEDTIIVYKINHQRIQELREKAIKIIITTFRKPMEEKDTYIAYPNAGVDNTMMNQISEPILLENISIVDIHYGYMGEEIRTDTDYHQFYVLPIKLSRLTKSRRLLDQWISA